MNWINHLDTMATILVSADVASICVSAVFFSERVRRWTSRRRWGSHPLASALSYSVAVASMDDISVGHIRPHPLTVLRNPFDPKAREELANGTTLETYREAPRRPTFRRSTVLQQRIAAYERALADFVMATPERQDEPRIAALATEYEPLNPYFERFTVGNLQEAHPF